MTSRILVPVDSLTRPELLQIADQLRQDRHEQLIELARLHGQKIAHDAAFPKNIKRLIFYGLSTLIAIFFSSDDGGEQTGGGNYLYDVATSLALVGVALMVWEALGFAGEVSESHRLEDDFENLRRLASRIDRELGIISAELLRRSNPLPRA